MRYLLLRLRFFVKKILLVDTCTSAPNTMSQEKDTMPDLHIILDEAAEKIHSTFQHVYDKTEIVRKAYDVSKTRITELEKELAEAKARIIDIEEDVSKANLKKAWKGMMIYVQHNEYAALACFARRTSRCTQHRSWWATSRRSFRSLRSLLCPHLLLL